MLKQIKRAVDSFCKGCSRSKAMHRERCFHGYSISPDSGDLDCHVGIPNLLCWHLFILWEQHSVLLRGEWKTRRNFRYKSFGIARWVIFFGILWKAHKFIWRTELRLIETNVSAENFNLLFINILNNLKRLMKRIAIMFIPAHRTVKLKTQRFYKSPRDNLRVGLSSLPRKLSLDDSVSFCSVN